MSKPAQAIADAIAPHQKLQFKFIHDEASRQMARQRLQARVEEYLRGQPGEALRFVLPGFPFKFPIRTIYGYRLNQRQAVDAADYFALQELEKLILAVAQVYAPGITIDVLMDSEGFIQAEQLPVEVAGTYKDELEGLVKRMRLEQNIRFVTFSDLRHHDSFSAYQQRLWPTLESFVAHHRVNNPDSFLGRYIGVYEYQRKQLRHLLAVKDDALSENLLGRKSRLENRLKQATKEAAYQQLWHQDTWRQLVREHFPNYLRLTIHPQPPDSDKIGLYLSGRSNLFSPVPWQGVPLRVVFTRNLHRDIIVDYSELLKSEETVPLRNVYFSKLKRRLPCFVIDAGPDATAVGNSYQLMMDRIYLARTRGLMAFESDVASSEGF